MVENNQIEGGKDRENERFETEISYLKTRTKKINEDQLFKLR